MKTAIAVALLLLAGYAKDLRAQESALTVRVTDAHSGEVLPGASVQVKGSAAAGVASADGIVVINGVAIGRVTIVCRFVGYQTVSVPVDVPAGGATVDVALEPAEEELEEVIITTTRTSRSIDEIPTRVEFIGAEELEEKITMQPGNIRMVLSESTGIQTQQTSVASANATIRIQGLEGRYTQILKDGFPLYSGFAGGLSIMQIPPLDLQQVDVIKGSASTLYGGGAIAGLVNLISKQPREEAELMVLGNATSAGGIDLSGYYGQKFSNAGVTVYASRNSSAAYDPADIGFSAIPEFERYTVNPRLFLYPGDRVTVMAGINASVEDRLGGDMRYLRDEKGAGGLFFEENRSERFSTELKIESKGERNTLAFRNSFNHFDRTIRQQGYLFSGKQLASFTEVTLERRTPEIEWVAGANAWTDRFAEDTGARNFSSTIAGVFVQGIAEAGPALTIEGGLRADYATAGDGDGELKKLMLLPRVSALVRISERLSSRIGGGLGYKAPTIFTERAEEQVFRNVRPLDFDAMSMERSYGLNADLNYIMPVGEDGSFSINHLFFYTRLNSHLGFDGDSLLREVYYFRSSTGHIATAGMETNVKVEHGPWKLFAGYTFVDAADHVNGEERPLPLTARSRINSVLMYEVEGSLRIGLEAFYFSRQRLSSGAGSTPYWILGFSAQKKWEHVSVFVNFENFTDTRQTRFGPIYSGAVEQPVFSEIYAPLDGFVFNAGFLLYL